MSLLEGELHMRKILMAMTIIVLASLSMVGTAQAQDAVIGTVVSDPAMVPAAGEYTMTATGSDFIADTAVLLVACVSPADTLVPGVSDLAEIVAAANAISPLADCDLAAAQNVEVDGNGGWTAVLTANVGDNFFLSAGALDGSQAGATWIPIVPSSGLPNTGAETGLLAIVGTAVLGAGVLVAGVGRRVRR
jgi:LPXTG-motif cell wall-anchored protein